ncbi:MAG: methionyl-tRNA formyltransferase [Lachnospiraceae bacterium]|jgi:methionyl-tRNA formyltransferase|uniref:methionyl-tRNA formyltransferase n=1 Tax=Candidatus Merdisoma sp. JLR.KK006 TaxID=3112626 RepID=UPI002FF3AF0B|nr:methionyl-tRNA formyltransferase [Lachnospiraceae bacterium]
MKIIFMGTPDFAVGTLEALIEAGHEITLVVSQPDKPKGRGHELVPTPVKAAALSHNLQVYQPVKLREEAAEEVIRNTEADVIVVVAFGQLISQSILNMKSYGCINVHGSLLPKYRGAAPIQWAVIDGEPESGITIMQMDAGLDTGDMLLKAAVPLEPKETGGSLFEKLSARGASLCVEALEKLEAGTLIPQKQGESPTAYARMLTKDMGEIDWSRPAIELERLIRGLNPWPSAYTQLSGKTLKIWDADVCEEEQAKRACGEIVRVTKDAVYVACGQGLLKINELQLQGKKRMDTAAFLRGYHLEKGSILG